MKLKLLSLLFLTPTVSFAHGLCVPGPHAPEFPSIACSTQNEESCSTANDGGCEWHIGHLICTPGSQLPDEASGFCHQQPLERCAQVGCEITESFED